MLRDLSQLLKTERDSVLTKVERLLAEQKQLEKEISTLKGQLIAKDSGSIMDTVRTIAGVRVLVTKVLEADAKALREYGDRLKDRMESGIIVVGSAGAETAQIIAMVTKDIARRFPAKRIIEEIAPLIQGRGGGKDEMAQAGGKCPEKLDEALAQAAAIIETLAQKR